jgi:hypothetical protein
VRGHQPGLGAPCPRVRGGRRQGASALERSAPRANPVAAGKLWRPIPPGSTLKTRADSATAPGVTTGWWQTYTDTNPFSNTPFG